MTNYIRAWFYIENPIKIGEVSSLLGRLENFDIFPLKPPEFQKKVFIKQELIWINKKGKNRARLLQIPFWGSKYSQISFDIDSEIFLTNDLISYIPNKDIIFQIYKNILVQLIIELKPKIGVIDYEADLIDSLNANEFKACWGIFLPQKWLNTLTFEENNVFQNTIDEKIEIPENGSLVFIHPLEANQSWGIRLQIITKLFENKKFTIESL